MKKIFHLCCCLCLGLSISSTSLGAPTSEVDTDFVSSTTQAHPAPKPTAPAQRYNELPTHFIKNNGQLDDWVTYYEKGRGHTVFFAENEVVVLLNRMDGSRPAPAAGMKPAVRVQSRPEILKFRFMHANPHPEIVGEALQVGGKINFSINGHIRQEANAPAYKIVRYKNIYPGIDVRFYGKGQIFEYDFLVQKGADPSAIEVAVQGAQSLDIDKKGNLVISLKKGRLIKQKPVVYQLINGQAKIIAGQYVINEYSNMAGRDMPFSFKLAGYDSKYPLTIDPILDYQSYLGF
ncbi:MAG: hypothetical protein D6698_00395 [Gammaproteobacteria bacterium]|nr:MAG: hypothetical protein D6698_00395 [Gammaproteobacteria bacterium]